MKDVEDSQNACRRFEDYMEDVQNAFADVK